MASSSKRPPVELLDSVAKQLRHRVVPGQRLLLGLSGGLDSAVLLDLLWRLAPHFPFSLSALHVHHGLSSSADAWGSFCEGLCLRSGIPLRVVTVHVPRRDGQGLEAAAREARYRAFGEQDTDWVLLGHHRDDQVETVLLQLFRGAGADGLAAMPAARELGLGLRLLRPLLEATRGQLEDYARQRGLDWVEDESNLDTGLRRNFLRHRVLPLLEEGFPGCRKSLARSAGYWAEASGLLEELAALDARDAVADGCLKLAIPERLSLPRAKNLLRYFLRGHGVRARAAVLEEALRQALRADADAQVCIPLGNMELRRYSGALWLVPRRREPDRLPARWPWSGEVRLALGPGLGVLEMRAGEGQGISLARLTEASVTVRRRAGGECIRPDAQRPRRTLKNLLRESGMPPWRRQRLPLLYSGETLVWVPGVGTEWDYRALPGEPSVAPAWLELANSS